MSIRLNKALRELNIGLQTAVEFLEKKGPGRGQGRTELQTQRPAIQGIERCLQSR